MIEIGGDIAGDLVRLSEEMPVRRSAGGKTQRHRAESLQDAAQFMLSAPLIEDEDAEAAALLCQMGLEPDQQSAILLRFLQQAKAGDIRSAQFVRDLSGPGKKDRGGAAAEGLKKLSVEELERMLGE